MHKKGWMMLTSGLAACVLLTALITGVQVRRARAAQREVHALQESALLSAAAHLSDMEQWIDKALLAGDNASPWLSRIGAGAQEVVQCLAMLPVDAQDAGQAMKFANQLQDFAVSLEKTAGGAVNAQQEAMLRQLSQACAQLKTALQASRDALSRGDAMIWDQTSFPVLVYDGAYSDGQTRTEPVMLRSLPQITREQALASARDFLGAQAQNVRPGTNVYGPIPCYGVTAELDGVPVQMAVTAQGGRVMWMFPDRAGFDMALSVEQCRVSAQAFLDGHGFPAMDALHFEVYDGLAVIHFAPLQGSVVLYPDLVKVQVRMDTGAVIGLECTGYLTHHSARAGLVPRCSEAQAMAALSPRLEVNGSGRLCLLPAGQQEILCYEFRGEYEQQQYLCYVNADSCQQEEILKVVETPWGIRVE